jgi:nucleoside-diphosphate-sugar epimerase
MKVLVAGATGVIGRQLVPRLVENGHAVVGMTRSARRADRVRSLGAEPVVADILDRARLEETIGEVGAEVIINQVTSLPQRLDPRQVRRDLAATNRLRREGMQNLVAAARAVGTRRIVSQSIAFAYAPNGPAPATEDEPLYLDAPGGFDEAVAAIVDLEQAVLNAPPVEGIVLRYGHLYGPGTVYGRDGSTIQDVRRRRFPLVGNGEGRFSFIHVDDVAAATARAIAHGRPGVYNVVDDEPVPVREWLPWLADLLSAPAPLRLPRFVGWLGAGSFAVHMMTRQRGASNHKARQSLGWVPIHPTWHDGFRLELGADFSEE